MNEGPKKSLAKWVLCGLLAAVTLGVYVSVGGNDFINIDDPDYVANNLHVQQGLTLDTVHWAFGTFHSSNWHPLTWLSHALDCQMYRLNPAGHHLTNLAFHIANTVLLFLLLVNLTNRIWAGAWVALLFGIHPMHVESVAWVAERKDLLCAFFFFLTLLAYAKSVTGDKWQVAGMDQFPSPVTRRPSPYLYCLALVFFAGALMSKPMAVTLPIILLLLDFWPLRRFTNWKRLLVEKIPFVVLSAVSCWLTMMAQATAMNSGANCPLETRLGHLPVAYAWYVFKLVWPVDHSIFYIMHGTHSMEEVAGAVLLLGLISGLVLWRARRQPALIFGWLWFVIMLVPVVGLVQVGSQAYAERYTYLPYIGLFIMVAWGVPALVEAWRWPRMIMWIPALAIVMVCCTLTAAQVRVWRTPASLFKQAVETDNQNERAWVLYGQQYCQTGNPEKALECLQRALVINPHNAETYSLLGQVYILQGKNDDARAAFDTAMQIAGSNLSPGPYKVMAASIQQSLGDLYLKTGQTSEAISALEASLSFQPEQPTVLILLGKTYLQDNQVDKAEAAFTAGTQMLGRDVVAMDAEMGLATIASARGNNAGVIAHYRRALSLNPDSAMALNNLAWTLATAADASLRNGPEAVQLAERACQVTKYGEPYYIGTLAAAEAEAGRFKDAVRDAQRARDLAKAHGMDAVAAKNEELMNFYMSGHAYHEEWRIKNAE